MRPRPRAGSRSCSDKPPDPGRPRLRARCSSGPVRKFRAEPAGPRRPCVRPRSDPWLRHCALPASFAGTTIAAPDSTTDLRTDSPVIIRKTPEEVAKIAAAGDILVRTLRLLEGKIRPGVTTAELDSAA